MTAAQEETEVSEAAPDPVDRPRKLIGEKELQQATAGRARVRLALLYRAGAILLALLLMAVAAQAVLSLQANGRARATLLDRVDPAILRHFEIGQALRSQDTAVRGYAATGAGRDLAEYRTAVREEAAAVSDLRSLLADVPESAPTLERLDRFAEASAAWRTGYADPLATRQRPGLVPAATARNGERLLADTWAAATELRAALTTLHHASADRLSNRAMLSAWSVGLALGVIAIGALIAVIVLRRTLLRPLASLSGRVRAVSQGDFQHPLEVRGAAEIAELSTIIDAMRRRILAEWHATSEATRLLDEQTVELRRSNAELEQFAYVASHDLQEPLRKVASFCQMIERRYGDQLDERGRQYIYFAVDGAKRMQALINDLLSFSRVGRMSRPEEAIDLGAVMGQALDNLSTLREETGAEVTSDELPTVPGDRTQLTQLFQNLIGNAMKFRGDEPPRIHVGVRRVGDEWEFSCSDNGIGIEPHQADRVFLIFQRLHPRDQYGGTGIGLALCKKIVEHHGGRIWLDTGASTDDADTSEETHTTDETADADTADDAKTAETAEIAETATADTAADAASGEGPAAPRGSGTTIRWTMPVGDDDGE
ncbi:ATP-binding protein [Spirillospora sp. NPDC048911]|uniref:sensor histidine kinase n=1 Tax=Spirillospora sp. NPDC048911 TaxID=3364527 RepID=UPI0037169A9A